MPDDPRQPAKKDYFTALVLSVALGLACLVDNGFKDSFGQGRNALVIAGFALLFAAVLLWRLWPFFAGSQESQDDETTPPARRLRAMATIWYALSVAMAVSLVRVPFHSVLGGGAADVTMLEWILGSTAVVAMGFALWRVIHVLRGS